MMETTAMSEVRRPLRRVAAALCALALGVLALGGAQAQDTPYFAGKQIKLIVPTSAGGGTDTTARVLAPFLQKFIAGNPTVIVENRSGGQGIPGANHFEENEPHDGTVWLVAGSGARMAHLLKMPGVRYDLAKMKTILGLSLGAAAYVPAGSGIKTPEDFVKGPYQTDLFFAATAATAGDLRYLIAFDLLGVEYEAIFGFEGGGDTRIAFERGEGSIGTDNILSFNREIRPQIAEGKVVPVMSTGLVYGNKVVPVDGLEDIPTATELYERTTGKKAEGPGWEAYKLIVAAIGTFSKAVFVHGDIPPEALDAINAGLDAMLADPETAKALEAEFAGSPPLRGEALAEVEAMFANPNPETMAWLETYMADRWDYKFTH